MFAFFCTLFALFCTLFALFYNLYLLLPDVLALCGQPGGESPKLELCCYKRTWKKILLLREQPSCGGGLAANLAGGGLGGLAANLAEGGLGGLAANLAGGGLGGLAANLAE